MKITERMIRVLAKQYPGKKIVCLPDRKNPKEVICEIFTAPDKSFSVAVALIAKSVPHWHKNTHETYRVLKGAIRVMHGALRRGKILTPDVDSMKAQDLGSCAYDSPSFHSIYPSLVHCAWAVGKQPATVLVVCSPAWNKEDHHIRKDIKKPFDLSRR